MLLNSPYKTLIMYESIFLEFGISFSRSKASNNDNNFLAQKALHRNSFVVDEVKKLSTSTIHASFLDICCTDEIEKYSS